MYILNVSSDRHELERRLTVPQPPILWLLVLSVRDVVAELHCEDRVEDYKELFKSFWLSSQKSQKQLQPKQC